MDTPLKVTLPLSDERFKKVIRHRREDESIVELIFRLLDNATAAAPNTGGTSSNIPGIKTRYFDFPEGFEIFRTSNGTRYSAKASRGNWVTPAGDRYSSLNELSRSVTSTPENAWLNWYFVDSAGRTKRLNELRDKRKVATRKRSAEATDANQADPTWRDDVYAALKGIGESATLHEIYVQTKHIRKTRGAKIPLSAEAIIRRTLEECSSDSDSFRGRHDLFRSVFGIGSGVWAAR